MASTTPASRVASTVISTVGATTTTASITPAANETLIVWWLVTSGAAFTDTGSVSGAGLTWTKVAGIVNGNDYAACFVGYGGTPSAGTLTLTNSRTPTAGRYAISGITQSQSGSTPVATSASNSGTATSGSVVMTQSGTDDQQLFAVFMHKAAEATTPATGWTELTDVSSTYGMESQYSWGRIDASASWTSNVWWAGIAFSVNALGFTGTNETDVPATGAMYTSTMRGQEDTDFDVWAIIE